MTQLRFDNQVVIVTGAGGELGKSYCLHFAARGAAVIVNDIASRAADAVVGEIIKAGGRAAADHHSVLDGSAIVEHAVQEFGRLDILVNNASISRDVNFENMTDQDWDDIDAVHVKGKEGVKYNILVNAIMPVTSSHLMATTMTTEKRQHLDPKHIAPLVAYLGHPANKENGSIFEVGAGHVSKYRWERSQGAVLKCDETLTPGAILKRWSDINNFSEPDHPINTANMVAHLEAAKVQDANDPGDDIRYDNRVAVVTGGGAGFGRIDILINNAGILRDKAFVNMTEKQWDEIINVHLRGTYSCTKAAYPHMLKQKYGRIVNTSSTSGIYGNYGQANYATAKMAILGFSTALAREGLKYNILVNTIAPSAGTQLTRTVLSEELVNARKPEFVAPLVLALCSDNVRPNPTGGLYEVGCGWQGRTRWQRSRGVSFELDSFTPEALCDRWSDIVNFEDGRADNPETLEDGYKKIMNIAQHIMDETARSGKAKSGYLASIDAAKQAQPVYAEFTYNKMDAILYNVSIGADNKRLDLVYEDHPKFQVLPTYGDIVPPTISTWLDLTKLVPNFSYKMLLHGEQYLEIRKWPIPTSAKVRTAMKVVDVIDKGSAAVVVTGATSVDVKTDEELFYNETTLFIRGSGGFGGAAATATARRRRAAVASSSAVSRAPDSVATEATSKDQAVVYRLNGDRNPLHIDPAVASAAGFEGGPILHGLCSFGIAGKAILERYGPFTNIRARFSGTIFPGQTLRVEMWKEGHSVLFQAGVLETGKPCLSAGGVCLLERETRL
ncbi:hypothetical protein E8E14_002837 [Neopestalotiopsis sp. 37M]|nr:hypothetical protein E8E14_002837 [Neopestalotiopsis sp. 37M]